MSRIVALSLAALLAVPAAAELDIGRLVMGRATYPRGSWVLDTFTRYEAARLSDSSADTLQTDVELERGQTDRFGWELAAKTAEAARDRVQWGSLGGELRYLALQRPAQLALAAHPTMRRDKPGELELEAETLKNIGSLTAVLQYSFETAARQKPEHALETAGLWRFGLQGLAGPSWTYHSAGRHQLGAIVGGAVARKMFLGIHPKAGIGRGAPDFEMGLEFHVFFGPYALGAWGVQ